MTRILPLLVMTGLVSIAFAADPSPIVQGNTAFACDLYGKLKDKPGNVFYSPFSVSAALGMTAAGAQGETLSEMARTLHVPEGQAAHTGFAELFHKLQPGAEAGYELSIANALWGLEGFPFRPEFVDLIGKNYGGGMRRVDFSKPEQAAATINRWVEEQTKNRIKDLVKPTMLSNDSRLVLTNAIYFKGLWKSQFAKTATHNEPFFLAAEQSTPAAMMHQTGRFRYADADGMHMVELPYKGDRLSMVVLLPKEKNQLAKIEAALTNDRLNKALGALHMMLGDVALPKFEFATGYDLKPPLQELGMKRAFSNGAQFGGMTSAEDLKIDFVVHKAFIKVDEEGSEAAAATAVGVKRAAAPVEQRFTFRADHPFIFLIRDQQTGSILFLGRVHNPKG